MGGRRARLGEGSRDLGELDDVGGPVDLARIRQVEVRRVQPGRPVDGLPEDVRLAGVPGEVVDDPHEHVMERDFAASGPPRRTADGVKGQLVDGCVREDPHPAVEAHERGHRDIGSEVHVGLRVVVIALQGDVARIGGIGPGATEGAAEVADLDVRAVLHDACQVRTGRCARHPQVALGQPVELPEQSVAGPLEVLLQRGLRLVCHARPSCSASRYALPEPNRSISTPWRSPRSLTVTESQPSLSMIVRTMQAPARITSARAGCNPTISRRPSASRVRYCSIWRSISARSRTVPWTTSGSYVARACLTAVMFVTPPPIPMTASGFGRPSSRDRSAPIAASASSTTSCPTERSRPNWSVSQTTDVPVLTPRLETAAR